MHALLGRPSGMLEDVNQWPLTELIALLALLWAIASSIIAWRVQRASGVRTERRLQSQDVEAALAEVMAIGHAADPLLEDGGFRLPDPVEMEARAETAIRRVVAVEISHPDDHLRAQAHDLVKALHGLRYELRLMRQSEARLEERTKAMALNVEYRARDAEHLAEDMARRLRAL